MHYNRQREDLKSIKDQGHLLLDHHGFSIRSSAFIFYSLTLGLIKVDFERLHINTITKRSNHPNDGSILDLLNVQSHVGLMQTVDLLAETLVM